MLGLEKQQDHNNNTQLGECECEKVSHVWLWAILFMVVIFICMVEW